MDNGENPPYRGNLIERLYEKKLSLLAESKLTLLNHSLSFIIIIIIIIITINL